MEQHLFDEKTQQTKAICKSVMVAINKEDGTSVPIIEQWKDLLSKTEKRAL